MSQFVQRTASAPASRGFKLERTGPRNKGIKATDELALFFMKYPVKNNIPRHTTGTVRLMKQGHVVTVDQDELLTSVFKKFVTEGFKGAPVLDTEGKYCGFIDMMDIVWWTIQRWRENQLGPSTEAFGSFFDSTPFTRARVRQIMKTSYDTYWGGEGFQAISGDYSLFTCLEHLTRSRKYNLPLVDNFGNINGILTRSMCISLMSQNLEFLEDFKRMKVSTMFPNLAYTVCSVFESQTTIDAFEKIATLGVQGLAVKDSEGRLVDSISTRDLRGIGLNAEKFHRLWLPISDFKALVRKEFNQQTPPKPICVTKNDTVQKVLELMDDGNIHRVYAVDSPLTMRPTHVLSQIDILNHLLLDIAQSPSTLKVSRAA